MGSVPRHHETSAVLGPIERHLTEDHSAIDALLAGADRGDGTIDVNAYAPFRARLLRHIALEEKVLLPFARERRGGDPLPIAKTLRRDHGEIASLLVPTPTPDLCTKLRLVLARHNALEEGPEGLYATCDALAGPDAEAVVQRMREYPEVPVAAHYDGPLAKRLPASAAT